jgi:hypothetical protein
MIIDLSAEELQVLLETVERHLVDFRREVAGTENPDFRHELQKQQNALERVLMELRRQARPESSAPRSAL